MVVEYRMVWFLLLVKWSSIEKLKKLKLHWSINHGLLGYITLILYLLRIEFIWQKNGHELKILLVDNSKPLAGDKLLGPTLELKVMLKHVETEMSQLATMLCFKVSLMLAELERQMRFEDVWPQTLSWWKGNTSKSGWLLPGCCYSSTVKGQRLFRLFRERRWGSASQSIHWPESTHALLRWAMVGSGRFRSTRQSIHWPQSKHALFGWRMVGSGRFGSTRQSIHWPQSKHALFGWRMVRSGRFGSTRQSIHWPQSQHALFGWRMVGSGRFGSTRQSIHWPQSKHALFGWRMVGSGRFGSTRQSIHWPQSKHALFGWRMVGSGRFGSTRQSIHWPQSKHALFGLLVRRGRIGPSPQTIHRPQSKHALFGLLGRRRLGSFPYSLVRSRRLPSSCRHCRCRSAPYKSGQRFVAGTCNKKWCIGSEEYLPYRTKTLCH